MKAAEAAFQGLVRAMCLQPEHLTIEMDLDGPSKEIRITCSPTDSKRLVGKQRKHLNQIEWLARQMFGEEIQMYNINSLELPELPYMPFTPNSNWPRQEIEAMTAALAEAIFYRKVVVQGGYVSKSEYRIRVLLNPEEVQGLGDRFSKAISILYRTIGSALGCRIFAGVQEDWRVPV